MKNSLFNLLMPLVLIVSACNQTGKYAAIAKEYKYEKEFESYLAEQYPSYERNEAVTKLIVVPLTSCAPCVNITLTSLTQSEFSTSHIFLIGHSENEEQTKERADIVSQLSARQGTFVDEDANLFRYRVNITKPTILLLKDNAIQRYIELNESVWAELNNSIREGSLEKDLQF